ncbi:hypothetical protein Q5752_006998 [Cryptotrichosporon argae]
MRTILAARSELPAYLPYTAERRADVVTFVASVPVGLFLSGVIVACVYFYVYRRDSRFNQFFLITLLTTVETALNTARLVQIAGTDAGNYAVYLELGPALLSCVGPLFVVFTSLTCVAFMMLRVVRFSRAMRVAYSARGRAGVDALAVFLAAAWVGMCVIGVAPGFYLMTKKSTLDVMTDSGPDPLYHALTTAQISVFMFMDVVLVVCMTAYLLHARSGFSVTNTVVDRLRVLGIANGGLALLVQTLQLMLAYVCSRSWFLVPFMMIGKVRALCVFALIITPRRVAAEHYAREEGDRARARAVRDGIVSRSPLVGAGGGSGQRGVLDAHGPADEGEKDEPGLSMTLAEMLDADPDVVALEVQYLAERPAGVRDRRASAPHSLSFSDVLRDEYA